MTSYSENLEASASTSTSYGKATFSASGSFSDTHTQISSGSMRASSYHLTCTSYQVETADPYPPLDETFAERLTETALGTSDFGGCLQTTALVTYTNLIWVLVAGRRPPADVLLYGD